MHASIPSPPRADWRTQEWIFPHLVTIAAYLLLASWATDFTLSDPPVPLIWPATGVGLAMVYRYGQKLSFSVFFAGFLAHTLFGMPTLEAGILAAGTTLGVSLGALILHRLNFDACLERTSDLWRGLVVGIGITAIPGALFGTLIATGTSADFPKTLGVCWLADVMGILLFAPLFLTAHGGMASQISRRMAGVLGAIALLTTIVYAGLIPDAFALPLSYAIFPAVLITAFLYPVWVVATAVMLAASIAITLTDAGRGPFAQVDLDVGLLSLQAHLALLAITGLLVAAIRHEREGAETRARQQMRLLARINRLNAVSTMAASLAHEINQPLCAVSSYAQTADRLLRRHAENPEQHCHSQLREAMQGIAAGTAKASAIVSRTRRMLEKGEQDRQRRSLNAVVRDAMEMLGPEIRRHRITVHTDTDPALPAIALDNLEMQQVVINLVHNAIEAVRECGDNRRWIGISTRLETRPGRAAMLNITDGGAGLPTGDPEVLFEPLTTNREHGTGLGLAVSRSIVEAHGGNITACDSASGGASFTIRLPL